MLLYTNDSTRLYKELESRYLFIFIFPLQRKHTEYISASEEYCNHIQSVHWHSSAANGNRFNLVPCYPTVFKRGPQLPWPQSQAQQFPRWRPAHKRGGPVECLEEFGRWARPFYNEPLAQKLLVMLSSHAMGNMLYLCHEKPLVGWPFLMQAHILRRFLLTIKCLSLNIFRSSFFQLTAQCASNCTTEWNAADLYYYLNYFPN